MYVPSVCNSWQCMKASAKQFFGLNKAKLPVIASDGKIVYKRRTVSPVCKAVCENICQVWLNAATVGADENNARCL